MKTVSKLDEIERVFLEDLSEDYEGIWTLADRVRDALGVEDPSVVREITLKLVHDWLSSEWILAGVPMGDAPGFEPWPEKGDDAAVKIAAEWREGESPPLLGEVAWFSLTSKGEKLIEKRAGSER